MIRDRNASPCLSPYVPISAKEKFNLATYNAFNPASIAAAAWIAGEAQSLNSNRPFGQEGLGYSRYLGAAFGSHVIGDYLTQAIFPSLFHQDPRYFRKGIGSKKSRAMYAVSRVFRTQADAGETVFNYSRVLGSSSEVLISSLYYAKHRDAEKSSIALSTQLSGAMVGNILKEFGPDLQQRFLRRRSKPSPSGLTDQ